MAFTDNFSGTLDQFLESRSGWTRLDGVAGALRLNNSNQLKDTGNGASHYICTNQGDVNHFTEVSLVATVSFSGFICTRLSTNNWIGFRHNLTSWQLYKSVNGSFTLLGSYAASLVSGDLARLTSDGNNHTLRINGTPRVGPISDAHNNTVTTQGLISRTSNFGAWVDNFLADVVTSSVTLAGNNVSQANSSLIGQLSQTHVLSGNNSSELNYSSQSWLIQDHYLYANNVSQQNVSGQGVMTQGVTFQGSTSLQSNTSSSSNITQTNTLSGNSVGQSNTSSSSNIVQVVVLSGNIGLQSNDSSSGQIIQHITFFGQSSVQYNNSSVGDLVIGQPIQFIGNNSLQSNLSSVGLLPQDHVLYGSVNNQFNLCSTGSIEYVPPSNVVLIGNNCVQNNLSRVIIGRFSSTSVLFKVGNITSASFNRIQLESRFVKQETKVVIR